jgi:hypothetical protein
MRGTSYFVTTLVFTAFLVAVPAVQAQKKGQNVIVQYGTVIQKETVNLNSAVPRGAVVGGALGLASAGGKSNKKKARNALVGAAAGGACCTPSTLGLREWHRWSPIKQKLCGVIA